MLQMYIKCPKGIFSTGNMSWKTRMWHVGKVKNPMRAQRDAYAEQRELKSLSFHEPVSFLTGYPFVLIYIIFILKLLWLPSN